MEEVAWRITDSGDIIYLYIGEPTIPSHIVGPVKQIHDISTLLSQNYIPHAIDRDAISIDGNIETTQINLSISADMSHVLDILSNIGKKFNKQGFPKVTIFGSHIAAKRFNVFIRAIELIIFECEDRKIDISKHRLEISVK